LSTLLNTNSEEAYLKLAPKQCQITFSRQSCIFQMVEPLDDKLLVGGKRSFFIDTYGFPLD